MNNNKTKHLTYVDNIQDFNKFQKLGFKNFILTSKKISRFGHNTPEEINSLASKIKIHSNSISLEWDSLSTESNFQEDIKILKSIDLKLFSSIRVQDYGAIHYIFKNSTIPIDLILETANHNKSSLHKWQDYLGERLNKVILSNQLTGEEINEFSKIIKSDIEILTIGPILLFYSPRVLLNNLEETINESFIVNSLESSHKNFYIHQNHNGTFMFHPKHLFLIDQYTKLQQININYYRYDFRFPKWLHHFQSKNGNSVDLFFKNLDINNLSENNLCELKKQYPFKTISGFFNANKSNIIFKKLKNNYIHKDGQNYIGEVVESYKGKYLAIKVENNNTIIKSKDKLLIKTPDKVDYELNVNFIKDSFLNEYDDNSFINSNGVFLINYMKKISPKSTVYLKN
jgi:U32 family peptidase